MLANAKEIGLMAAILIMAVIALAALTEVKDPCNHDPDPIGCKMLQLK